MWMGNAGSPTTIVSPGPSSARHRWLKPSFEPMVAMTSVSGSSSTPYFFLYFGDAVADRVAVVSRIERGLHQFFDHRLGRRIGRVAHPQVDDVAAVDAQLVLHLVDAAKQIRRQARDARADFNFEWVGFHVIVSGGKRIHPRMDTN
jgi:hypothetical protein